MYIAEARAYNDGIEFYPKNGKVIFAKRCNGKVVVESGSCSYSEKKENRFKSKILLLLLVVVNAIIFSVIGKLKIPNIEVILVALFVWEIVLIFYIGENKNKNNTQSFKYHAAEHKVLNYVDKYGKNAVLDVEKVMYMSSVSFRCGSTVFAVGLIFATLFLVGKAFIPWLILKIVWLIISGYIALKLWANGKCDFLQKLVLVQPTYEEVEVAVEGMKEYLRMREEESSKK